MKGTDFFTQMAIKPPFTKMHPKIAAFFKGYLANEKVVMFNDRYVLNTHFPPYPGRAFNNLVDQFSTIGDITERRLYSVTLAVTNRCMYNCRHCYNAGRSQKDIPLDMLQRTIRELQDMYAVRVTLSGGEPLLRDDLEEIAASFDDRTFIDLNTTGYGLTPERARALRDSGVFAVGVSVDSPVPDQHNRQRRNVNAYDTALRALSTASEAGLYPYVVTVATHELLKDDSFMGFMRFAGESGAREVHLLEPCPIGNLAGSDDAVLNRTDQDRILRYQEEIARDESLPILSSFRYLESPDAFGCGAGITHLYIDGSGEVSPCNFVPLSFGNIQDRPLRDILGDMGRHFRKPRTGCVGHVLARRITGDIIPTPPEMSHELCERYLPEKHKVPKFFTIAAAQRDSVGSDELRTAYNTIHEHYDEFWVKEAGKPVISLIEKLHLTGDETVFEVGCGTGFATARIAAMLDNPTQITAADISGGMLKEARVRAEQAGLRNINFVEGDALELMKAGREYDIILSSWVLGYIPLTPFFNTAGDALKHGGKLAFIVHKENSPREPLRIFGELVAEDPSILLKQVGFDFPRDIDHVRREIGDSGLIIEYLTDGCVVFHYRTPDEVLEHLLKSGAGTAFYEAVDPTRRHEMEKLFVEMLKVSTQTEDDYPVAHDYIMCIARKP